MSAPERYGLFTLCEVDEKYESESESEPGFAFHLPSANASSEILPSPPASLYARDNEMDFPQDVEGEELLVDIHRLSWSTTGSNRTSDIAETELATPDLELEDPFSLEYTWQDMPADAAYETVDFDTQLETNKPKVAFRPPHVTPRRPPPLDLASYHHPFSAASIAHLEVMTTPRSSTQPRPSALLPALPILPSSRPHAQPIPPSPITPRTHLISRERDAHDHADLNSALEDLLSSCGEQKSAIFTLPLSDHPCGAGSDTPTASSFPLPPTRSSALRIGITPSPKARKICPPPPPCQSRRDDIWHPTLRGDHSFLSCLSRAEFCSSGSSEGSGRSARSLPERKALPGGWMSSEDGL